ncbi:MAG: hypothetical protein Q8N17_26415 [Burkholderiaceae bacterium]|nr:hypothetical protein [Burkholderiaceae bacterium]
MTAQRRAPLPAWTPDDGNPFTFILEACRRIRAERQAEQGSLEAQRQLNELQRRLLAREFPDE